MIRNKKGYRRIILIFTAVTLVLMTVCTVITAYRKSNPTVYFINSASDIAYQHGLEAGIQSAETEFGVSVRRLEGMTAQTQIALIEQISREKGGILLLSPADREALAPAVEKARKSGIQTVFVGSRLKQDGEIPRVGTDDLLAGKKAVTALVGYLPKGGSIAVVGGNEGNSMTTERLEGIEAACQEEGLDFAGAVFGCTSPTETAEAIQRLLSEGTAPDGIIALGEASTLGAATALAEDGDTILLVGFGASPEQVNLLQKGKLRALIALRPRQTGYAAVKAAVSLGKGLRVSSFTDTGSVILTKENLKKPENQKLISEYKEME